MYRFQLVVGKFNRKKWTLGYLSGQRKFYKHKECMKMITYKGRLLGWQVFLILPFPFLILEKEEIFPGSGVHKNPTLKTFFSLFTLMVSESPPSIHPTTHAFFIHPTNIEHRLCAKYCSRHCSYINRQKRPSSYSCGNYILGGGRKIINKYVW